MVSEEVILAIIVFLFVAGILLLGPVLAIVALIRAGRVRGLERDLAELSAQVRQLRGQTPAGPVPAPAPTERPVAGERFVELAPVELAPVELVPTDVEETAARTRPPTPRSAAPPPVAVPTAAAPKMDGRALELFIGRKALGWVAVVVLLFGTVFFLRYAYENQWIGPLGRVSIGVLAGVALVAAGWKYQRRGWRIFSQMLTAAGVLTLYLATYSAFGFYRLIPQQTAGILLFVVIAESALLAILYDAWSVALMALVGGLLIPMLMQSDRDQYVSLFTYLAILNAGSLAILQRRAWLGIGTVALVGTQLIYWAWYGENYHPEKLAWAAGFQGVVFLMHWAHGLTSAAWRRWPTIVEEIVRSSLNATAVFAALYVLLDQDHHLWLGSVAVGLAAIESLEARLLLRRPELPQARLLTPIAIATGFIALAFPLQAAAHWVAVGWAAQAAALYWFGLRVRSVPLRIMSLVLTMLAALRIVTVNAPWLGRRPFYPLWNDFATPSLLAVLLLAVALYLSRDRLARVGETARAAAGLVVVVCVALTWFVLSFDVYQYAESLANTSQLELDWQRVAQMSLSACWALFASLVLACGFAARLGVLRWSALAVFAVTVLKVFLVDMADLDEIYRIVAFLLLAVLLGAAAWAYQRLTVHDEAG